VISVSRQDISATDLIIPIYLDTIIRSEYMSELSAKQRQILEYMKAEVREKGYPPSVREICDAVGLKSTSTVHGHLSRLEKKGLIRRDPTKPRAIEILDSGFDAPQREFVNVPIVGNITAGTPILAVENIEDTFPIPVDYIHNDTVFMLRVKGESMERRTQRRVVRKSRKIRKTYFCC
jgi:repressor LexA